ncbi:MAG: formate dehydrogenase accessory sulfurtransferase FdhD [Rhodospirillales bacterium]|nr:formate dehydrogenase accessory sulfurtransferase FdhD [Rhodospirillales bacterium]
MSDASPIVPAARARIRGEVLDHGARLLAEETAIALTYQRATHAVMLASPADLEDFAIGFSLTEGIVTRAEDIESLEIVEQDRGIELRMWVADAAAEALTRRRRRLAGATGCGLCGVESLDAALAPVRRVEQGAGLRLDDLARAVASLPSAQPMNDATHAVHAAAFWRTGAGLVAVREDVGRHNALDKLAGALARAGERPSGGAILLTSRVSVEMVQKAAMIGAPAIVAISAPTALAVRVAEAAGIMLAGVARADGLEVFSHPDVCGIAPDGH